MKKSTKILALGLATVASLGTVSSLAGCGAKEDKDLKDPTVLNICMPDLGYGTDWMKNVAKGFTAKTGTRVNIDVTPTESGYVTAMYAGTAPYDIYCLRANTYSLVTANQANVSGYECILADYDDIYGSQVAQETNEKGEPLLFKDKMKDMYESYNRVYKTVEDEQNDNYHYYAVQWCDTVFSIVCNMDVWKSEWAVPNTTDELLALAEKIKDTKGYTPFIWSSQASYWWQTASLWVTQYQGLEDMYGNEGFWAGYSETGVKNTPDMWKRRGILEALTVLDELVKDENGYQHVLSTSVDFTTAQGYFCLPENKIAMMANGDWLYNEMKKNYPKANLKMMPMPVISAIRNHPDCQETVRDKNDGIETDAELSALISAIDAGSTALSGEGYNVSQKAFDKVYEARNMYNCSSNINHVMVTPYWSDSKEQVKEFMLYLASEEGQIKFAEGGNTGFTHCFETTDAVRAASHAVSNNFVKSAEALKQGKQVAPWPVYSSRLFSVGGMPVNPMIELGYNMPELIFSLTGSGYKDAVTIYTENYQNAKTKWASYMQTAGLA